MAEAADVSPLRVDPAGHPRGRLTGLFFSIRARVIALVCLTALPLLAVGAGFAIESLDEKRANAFELVTALARSSGARLDDEISTVNALLMALSHTVSVEPVDIAANDELLARVTRELPPYFNGLAAFDAQGRNIGLAPFQTDDRNAVAADGRDYFEEAIRGAAFAWSQPFPGPLTQRQQIVLARPIRGGADGAPIGVIAAGIILESMARIFDHVELPPGAVIRINNERGIVLARSTDAAGWVGRDLSRDPWVMSHLDAGFGVGEMQWADGGARLTASVRTKQVPWLVSVGVPAEAALAGSRAASRRAALLGGCALALALLAAWFMSGRLAKPIRQLVEDARIFGGGNLAHRSTVVSRSEIGLLAEVLNRTADQIAEASHRLREVGDELRIIIQASPIPIIASDRQRRLTLWNGAAHAMWGYEAAEVMGKSPPMATDAEDEVAARTYFGRILAGESLLGIDRRQRRKDGSEVETRMYAAPIPDGDGSVRGVVSLWLDRTEQNALEARLRQSQKMEAVGQLAGGFAHDINNILGIIVANLDMLEMADRNRGQDPELIAAALNASLRGADLVQQLLAFSRQQPLEMRPMRIRPTLERWTPLLRRTLGERTAVELDLPEDLWEVLADPTQLESCLLNITLNARDAMPDGGRLVISARNLSVGPETASANPGLREGDYVILSVTDSGTGIRTEILPRVFEPFFTTKDPGKGSGLGLSVVFGYMRQAGGTAKIYSEEGHGTSVLLYLPRVERVSGDESAGTSAMAAPATPSGSGRILVVDDNADMRTASVSMLKSLGYSVVEAGDAHEAIRAIDGAGPFDLVFSDIVMPGDLTGIDLARVAKSRGVRVLLTSGFANPVEIHAEAQSQGVEVLPKPYRKADLANRVRSLLDREAPAGA